MKIRKSNIIVAVSLGAMIAFTGCDKDNGALPSRVTTHEIPTITTIVESTGSQTISMSNLAGFSGKFTMSLYFGTATPPEKIDVAVRKTNGTTINNGNVKTFKTNVTTLPATFTVTAAEIAALFGTAIVLNDNYDFAPDIYVNGRKFEAFPAIGTGSGTGVTGMPLFKEFARFTAK